MGLLKSSKKKEVHRKLKQYEENAVREVCCDEKQQTIKLKKILN